MCPLLKTTFELFPHTSLGSNCCTKRLCSGSPIFAPVKDEVNSDLLVLACNSASQACFHLSFQGENAEAFGYGTII